MKHRFPFLLIGVAALSALGPPAVADPDRDDPRAELQSFRLPEGYEINLFASEKEGIVKPVAMRWDARGRLWVSCIPSYPQPRPGETPDDRIVVLEDTAHAGHADRATVFARGLLLPLGLELGDGGVYAANGNDLVHFKADPDSLRAGEPRAVLRGFYTADSHQDINSFVWGPGGELMFCQGLHAFARVETPHGVERLDKAGVWRYRPRAGRLDPFLGWDMGPQNPFGLAFDDWGQCLMVAGNGQGVYYMLPAMIRTRHFLDPRQIADTRNIKFCGADVIGTRALPDEAQGRLVTPSVLNNSVYWFALDEDGSGFHARDLPPLVTSTHPSFRGVDVKVGPDGAIYVADWYNPIIGHYQASLRHPDRDHAHGRIWRITYKGRPPVRQPDLAAMSPAELFEQLRSPERWTRYQAKRVLAEKDSRQVCDALGQWVSRLDPSGPRFEHLLLEALGVYETHEVIEPGLLERLLAAKDYRARAYAAGVIAHWHDRLADPLALLRRAAADPHPRVRLAAIVSASYVPSEQAIEAALIAADQPMDRFLNEALTQATAALKPYWLGPFAAGRLEFEGRPDRLGALSRADGSPDVLRSLLKLVETGKLSDESRAGAVVLLARAGGPAELAAVLASAEVRARPALLGRVLDAAADNLRRRPAALPPAGAHALEAMLASGDGEARRGALTLAGLLRLESLRPRIEATARAADAPDAERRAALEALADFGGAKSAEALKGLAGEGPPRGRALATAALARLDLKAAARSAAAQLAGVAPDAATLIPAFLSRQGGGDALAAELAGAKIPADSAKLALRALSAAGGQSPGLWEVLSKSAGNSGAKLEYDTRLVAALAEEAIKSGDPAAGERVFRGPLTNCLACHAIGGAGGRVGPDLAPVGAALPIDLVVESVLWPQRQIKEGYTATMVQTRRGEVFQGYRISEDKSEFVLREPTSGKPIHVPLADIKARREVGSLMPEGLTDGLTRKETVDLIRFLSELGKPGPYRVAVAPLVRAWETAAGDRPPADEAAWTPRYSLTSGELPLDETPAAEGIVWARCAIEVAKPGRVVLKVNDAPHRRLLVDGGAVELKEPLILDLAAGRHVLTIGSEVPRGASPRLSCRIDPAADSPAQVRLPGNQD